MKKKIIETLLVLWTALSMLMWTAKDANGEDHLPCILLGVASFCLSLIAWRIAAKKGLISKPDIE